MFYLSGVVRPSLSNLLVNIAAALLAVPVVYFIYELTRGISTRRLRVTLFDEAKVRIDTEMLSVLNQMSKLLIDYERYRFSREWVLVFLNGKVDEIGQMLRAGEYAGFQVFKSWDSSIEHFASLLDSVSLHRVLTDEQLIAVVEVKTGVERLDYFLRNTEGLFTKSGTQLTEYRVSSGDDLGFEPSKLPNHILLLRVLAKGDCRIADFGSFAKGRIDDLLEVYRVGDKHAVEYASNIRLVLDGIESWVKLTGSEFIMDEKMFRVGLGKTHRVKHP